MVSDPEKTAQQAVAIADAEIQNMEASLAVVRRQLAGRSGTAAEEIAIELKRLTEQVDASRARRDAIAKRAARVQRMTEIQREFEALRAELEPLVAKGDRGARFEELRQRALALHEEAERLRAAVKTAAPPA
jgi:hypothetical protein